MRKSGILFIIFFANIAAMTGCTIPKRFHQHIAEPVAVPELKTSGTKSVALGIPGELKFGYHIESDIYAESYVQRRGLTTGQFESGNGQMAVGASLHKIYGSDKNNISLGFGVDVGNSQGKNEKNASSGSSRILNGEITEHKLSYHQAYVQTSVMLHNAKELGIGISYKIARGEARFESGILSNGEMTLPANPGEDESQPQAVIETEEAFTNKNQPISYSTFALTFKSNLEKFVSDKINLELQLRLPRNASNFRSNISATFSFGYDLH